ncbi:MAG: flagellar basal body L-ring protein FlgH [Candidatus Gastranaerophilales bacterium]|nr:flagellar basal body L-ring protein FlgH [Candidatus Gastranaerophilales bacterium]
MNKAKSMIKPLISAVMIALMSQSAFAESLFQAGISQTAYPMQPKSLFSTVRARTVGDIITVIISENTVTTNNVNLDISGSSTMTDNFTSKIEKLLRYDRLNMPDMNNFGGSTTTSNKARMSRNLILTDTMTTQVVQVLPNGNLVIQGKKLLINSGEKTQIILSGIVDPRFISNAGTIESRNVANLQFAATGTGTTSRHGSESIINRIFGNLF